MVNIVSYKPKYRDAFRQLNEDWIKQYFEMEDSDVQALGDPQTYILDKGGEILIALEGDQVLGVCALIPMQEEGTMELAKMAVAPEAQGRKIGFMLGNAILESARKKGAARVYLESNTILEPAINLYRKLGFQEIHDMPSPYKRCNIQMMVVF